MMRWKQWMMGVMVSGGVLLGGRTTVMAAQLPAASSGNVTQVAPQAARLKAGKSKKAAVRAKTRKKGTKATAKTATSPRKVTSSTKQPVQSKKVAAKSTKPKKRATVTVKKKRTPTAKSKAGTVKYVSLVGRGRYTKPHIHFKPTTAYLKTQGIQNKPSTIKSASGYLDHYGFKTSLYLPQALNGRNLSVPQSAAFSADNRYLYVMYVNGKQPTNHYQDGWAVRYDWTKLMALGANQSGKMGMLRMAAADQVQGKLTKLDRKVLACIKVGPVFNSGHAQSLALNPKTNQFWFVKSYDQETPNEMVELNPKTLLPAATVTYHSDGANLGAVLTFDNQGNAYYWTHAKVATKKAPLGAVRIYRGQVSTKGIKYHLISQGLATDPGFYVQSMGYDGANGRLYLVSDESITSLPLADLGHLKTSEVGENNFNAHREFEGLFFMHHSSNGFLLTNKGSEVMQLVQS